MKRRLTVLVASLAVLALSASAMAAPIEDSLLVYGYDDTNATQVFGVSPVWQEGDDVGNLDCTLNGTYTYEVAEHGTDVTSLKGKDGEDASFGYEDDTSGSVTYADAKECQLVAVDATGPNGQFNHGTLVSSFVHALKAAGLNGGGCLVNAVSGLEYGKGFLEDDEEASTVTDPTEAVLQVMLETFETSCGKANKPEKAEKAEKATKPEKPAKPDKANKSDKGKANAPGQTKKNASSND